MCPATSNNKYISFKVKVPLGNNLFFFFFYCNNVKNHNCGTVAKMAIRHTDEKNENDEKSIQKQFEAIQKKLLILCQLSPSTDH